MVPVVADQVTVRFDAFVTVAVNETVPADCTVAVAGVTVTTTAGGSGIWRIWDPAKLLESLRITPKMNVAGVVGVPGTIPLVVAGCNPAGRCSRDDREE